MDFTEPIINLDKPPQSTSSTIEGSLKQNSSPVTRLENEIEEVYTLVESKFASLWSRATSNIRDIQESSNSEGKDTSPSQDGKKGVNIDLASISDLANKALDGLDSKLEIVEQKAGIFVNSLTSFFSGNKGINTFETHRQLNENITSPPILPGDAYGSSRFDMDLFKLHTTADCFLSPHPDEDTEFGEFSVDSKTQDINNLLDTYRATLEKLMNRLVPTELTYKEFWYRYFKQESKLKDGEKARKKLLSNTTGDSVSGKTEAITNKSGNDVDHAIPESRNSSKDVIVNLSRDELSDEDEEEFTWDDDDEVRTSDS